MINRAKNKGDHHLRYEIKQWKIKGSFDIINDISDIFTIVQLMETIVNLNHSVNIVEKCIFDSNH